MADKTINYNLTKPSGDDFYDVGVQNSNMDIVDAELKRLNDGKAPTGHGLGVVAEGTSSPTYKEFMQKGCGFYQTGNIADSPHGSAEWTGLIQLVRKTTEGSETGSQLAFYDFDKNNPRMWFRSLISGNASAWVELIHTGNLSKQTVFAKIMAGTYVGTGKSGSANKNVLSFSFTPKYLYIYCPDHIDSEYYDATFLYGCSNAFVHARRTGFSAYQDGFTVTVTWASNSVSWYYTDSSSSGVTQLNESGYTYYYVAIG